MSNNSSPAGPESEYVVERCLDNALSRSQITDLLAVYNECFYDGRITGRKQIATVKNWLSGYDTFEWYFIRCAGRMVAIGNYVRHYNQSHRFAIQPLVGENITSIAVSPAYRQRGLARQLLAAIASDHGDKALTVEIKRNNPLREILVKMYLRMGYKILPPGLLEQLKVDYIDNIYLRRDQVANGDACHVNDGLLKKTA